MLLLSYSLGEFERFSPTPPQILALIGALIFLGLVVTFGASILWNRLLQQYTSVSVVPYSLLIPVVGMLSSWLFFDDIAGKQLLPIALIVLGLAVTLRPARQTPQAVAASAATAPR
jgi:O-acetylserine/cysteine efflux transporter